MKTLRKIFVASSMLNPYRQEIPAIIERVNRDSRTLQFELVMFENTAFPAREIDNQAELNRLAAECDIFLFLIDRDREVGVFTMGEYKSAFDACRNTSMKLPVIMPYVIYSGDKVARKIPYKELIDGVLVEGESIEERIYNDFGGKRYSRFVPGENNPDWKIENNNFLVTFERDLKETIRDSFHYYRQEELSYAYHISNTEQNLRKSDTVYFVREPLDGAMENIIEKSSLLIIEGNSFSGKTRAVYQLMKNKPQWSDADFYVYRCGYDTSLENINHISTYRTAHSRHAVIFIDDFSKILDNGNIESNAQFWQLLRSVTPDRLPRWDKITIIITLSGELTYHEKHRCYKKIFGNEIYARCFNEMLRDIIVNFDIYDRRSFRNMAAEMVRCGIIPKDKVRPGNYTIGSLFVDITTIQAQLQALFGTDPTLQEAMQLVKMQLMYCNRMCKGLYANIVNMWCHRNNTSTDEKLVAALETLCSMRWIVLEYDNNSILRVHIDKYVVEAIVLPNDYLTFLIDYAQSGKDSDVRIPERMAYILCDRLCLSSGEIISLINDFGKGANIVQSLYNICNKYKSSYPDTKWEDQYANVFCQNAITTLPYNETVGILDKILAVINHDKTPLGVKSILEELYVKSVYRMLSHKKQYITFNYRDDVQILPLTMLQEREVLARIFASSDYRVDNMKSPFSEKDLLDVFNMRRIVSYIDMMPMDIVKVVEKAAVYTAPNYIQASNNDDFWGAADTVDDTQLNNIFIPQLSSLLIEVIVKTTTFDELIGILDALKNSLVNYIQVAIMQPMFTISFYKNIKRLALRYGYDDRFRLFNYLISLPDNHNILDVTDTQLDEEVNGYFRIAALNNMIDVLDENSVIQAYGSMMKSGKSDGYTLSMYMNNEFLMFEHLLDAVIKYGGGNYLTNNQLLYKAKTISDAQMCLQKVMNVRDGKPENLHDEFALGAYIGIERLPIVDAIEIIKKWKQKHPKKSLCDLTIGVLLSKLGKVSSISNNDVAKLFGIPDEGGVLATEKQLYDFAGLSEKEINILRLNPHCWNQFFQKLNRTGDVALLKKSFRLLVNNGIEELGKTHQDGTPCYLSTSEIVFDETYKTFILSEYVKTIFNTYEETRTFIEGLIQEGKLLHMTVYLYKQFLRKIVIEFYDSVKNMEWDVEQYKNTRLRAIDKVNAVLVEAYNYFAQVNTRQEVIENMSMLYNFRVQLVKFSDYEQSMPYAYEDKIIDMNFYKYLDTFYCKETAYIDGTFIFMTLCSMNKHIDGSIYNKLKEIAQKIHRGVDMMKKSKNKIMQLSKIVMDRLVEVQSDTIIVDKDLVYNYSPIKMLMYITAQENKTFEQMERYRENMGIPVTSTYLNYAFDVIKRDRNIAPDHKFGKMNTLLDTYCGPGSLLSKTIQMFVRMLEACRTIEQLDEVEKEFPVEFRDTSEFIGVWCRRYFDICFKANAYNALTKLRGRIVNNRHLIDIQIVNSYINAMYRMVKHLPPYKVKQEHKDVLLNCWKEMDATGYINLNTLFQLSAENNAEWKMQANQLSYIYFGHVSSRNIVEYIAEKFDDNFYYEYNKSCLKDSLKNYVDNQYHEGADLSKIVEIMTSSPIYKSEINEVLKGADNGTGKWRIFCSNLKILLNACCVVKKS